MLSRSKLRSHRSLRRLCVWAFVGLLVAAPVVLTRLAQSGGGTESVVAVTDSGGGLGEDMLPGSGAGLGASAPAGGDATSALSDDAAGEPNFDGGSGFGERPTVVRGSALGTGSEDVGGSALGSGHKVVGGTVLGVGSDPDGGSGFGERPTVVGGSALGSGSEDVGGSGSGVGTDPDGGSGLAVVPDPDEGSGSGGGPDVVTASELGGDLDLDLDGDLDSGDEHPVDGGEGVPFTYWDGDKERTVWLEVETAEPELGQARDGVVGASAGQGEQGRSVVFRDAQGDEVRLPGGVIVLLDPTWTAVQVDEFFSGNNIAPALVSDMGWIANGFVVDTEPGLAALLLANSLVGQPGVEMSSPHLETDLVGR